MRKIEGREITVIRALALRDRLVTMVEQLRRREDTPELRSLLCASYGHPRVVETCMGQVTCARCGTILGDTLAGAYDLRGKVVLTCKLEPCRDCDSVPLEWHETLLVGPPKKVQG